MAIDITSLSSAEISDLAITCLEDLSLAERVQAILKSLHDNDDRKELLNWLEEDIAEGEAEDEDEA
jgi:hypothetical protein